MRIIKNIIVAFSLYSQIPMPRFAWKEEDMKHNLLFLPWVGAVIGGISFGLSVAFSYLVLPMLVQVVCYCLVPLLVTGGFHVDGFMDVSDALSSYKTKEEKLAILKDPHIGAFAVIRLVIYGLLFFAAGAVCVEQNVESGLLAYCLMFFYVRALAAIPSLKMKHAKANGMLCMEANQSAKVDFVLCMLQAVIVLAVICYFNWVLMLGMLGVSVVHLAFYRHLCYKQFGGTTGDTVGYYITTLELWILVTIAVVSYCM